MQKLLRQHFEAELETAKIAMREKSIDKAWFYLARAHILGQFYIVPHLKTHFWMLILGIRTKNTKEISGQLLRLLLAAPGSFFETAPLGNTGLSNVGVFQPMPIPRDLQFIIDSSEKK